MKNAFTEIAKFERKEKRLPVEDDPTFGETLEASLKYKYAPLANFITQGVTFGFEPKDIMDTYDPSPDIPENLKPYASSLLMAKSPEHLSFKIRNLKKALNTNETLAKSGLGAQLGAELFDPINYVSIPFRAAKTGGQAFFKGGLATGAVVAGQEAVRYPLDPTANKEEVALNLGASFFLGGALKHATSIKSIRKINAIEDGKNAINDMKKALEADDVELDPNVAPSIFTDSWVYKAATNPMKRVMTNPDVPNSVKLRTLGIANDSGILLVANKEGKKIGNSVFQNAKLHEGTWVRTNDDLIKIWGQSTGKGVINPMDYMVKRGNYEDWLASVDAKAMRGERPATNFEAQAMEKLNKFYEDWEVQLRDQGLIGSQGDYTKVIKSRQKRLDLLEKRLKGVKNPEYATTLTGQINRITRELDEAKANLADLEGMGAIKPPNEEIFRPRYFDMGKIRNNRVQFEKILSDWFAKNPEIWVKQSDGKFKKETLSSDPAAINNRVKVVVDGMINEPDPLNPDKMYYGMGKSKHFKHRALDIPNALVLDYMVTNPVSVMKAYTKRTAARLEFSKKHNGDSIDDILDDTFNEMMDDGADINAIRAVQKDQRHLYDRVVGSVLRNPDAHNQTVAKIMRDLAQLNYLGSAGLATITEPAKIIMEHGLGPTMRGLFTVLKNNQLKLGAKEGRIAGEIHEIMNGSSQMRMVDDINNNPLNAEKMDKVKDAFYFLNGLSVITRALKDFDSMVRCHTLIDYSVRWSQGTASKMEQEYLLRYNVNLEDARKIANAPWQKNDSGLYLANTEAWTNTIEFPSTKADIISGPTNAYAKDGRYRPAFYTEKSGKGVIHIDEEYIENVMFDQRGWENPRVKGVKPIRNGIINTPQDYVAFIKMHEIMHSNNSAKSLGFDKRTKVGLADYENAINDMAIEAIEKQARIEPETVQTFRNALGSGIMNTILMGTPADKPIITDGIVYIPMRVAGKFGMKEDAAYKGYARIENGLLGLPFQFYSYSLAAVNKTMGAYAHGQFKSQYVGTAIAMGLGYMALQAKTPDWVELSFQDQFARSLDYSGIMPLYSDMFYTAMTTTLALNGPNITGGALQPKFPQEPNTADAVTGVLGAGPSITTDLSRAIYEMTYGDVGEGSKDFIRNLPYARLWFLKGKVNELTNMLEGELDGPRGFGRF
tara:strand:+ start:6844 stop:10359 length:3516 start_codon:yes stop_codon:yes gene_type:complete